MRTKYNGNMDGSFESLPFGDGYTVISGEDIDPRHFAGLDQDVNDNDHALYREYSSMTGRWMSPDPYMGSYNFANPQTLNRYAYVMNNPLAFTDPTGQGPYTLIINVVCGGYSGACVGSLINPISAAVVGGLALLGEIGHILGWWSAPQFHGSLRPRPSAPGNGCPVSANSINQYIAQAKPSSPLVGQGSAFMQVGYRYNIDPRLFVSLAGAETSFGTNITAGQYNALNVMYNGYDSPFSSFQSNINAAGRSLTNPANGYNLSNTSTMYSKYCSGSGCATGLKNLDTFMRQQGANIDNLHNPCGPQE